MAAEIKGALAQIDNYYKFFKHKDKPLTKEQVRAVLEYGINKGYETTDQLTDDEVDRVLRNFIYAKALEKWGQIAQLEKAQEEATELALAIRKFTIFGGVETLNNMCDEIADVEIMIEQIKFMYSEVENIENIIDNRKRMKLERLIGRLDNI